MNDDMNTIEITDAFSNAYKVRAGDVVQGMYVFDVFGGRHKVRQSTVGIGTFHISITREDGETIVLPTSDTITVSDYPS